MKLYRAVREPYNTREFVLQGIGAALIGGRWNFRGMPAIYCSTSIDGVVSEQAFHSFYRSIQAYNEKLEEKKGANFPRHYFESLQDKKFTLFELQCNPEIQLLDLTAEKAFQNSLTQHKLGRRRLEETRIGNYQLEKPQPLSRMLGACLSREGHPGIIVPSARTNNAKNVVLFQPNISFEDIEITREVDLKIGCLSEKHDSPQLGKRIHQSVARYNSSVEEGIADILHFG